MHLYRYRSAEFLNFEVGPFTEFFEKDNVGKTNVLEAWLGMLNPGRVGVMRGIPQRSDDGPFGRCFRRCGPLIAVWVRVRVGRAQQAFTLPASAPRVRQRLRSIRPQRLRALERFASVFHLRANSTLGTLEARAR